MQGDSAAKRMVPTAKISAKTSCKFDLILALVLYLDGPMPNLLTWLTMEVP